MAPHSSPKPREYRVYRYRFWGLPMGVSMLPRLAARVCSTTKGITNRSCPASRSTTRPKGTKVIRDTSLVMTMLKKKGRNTSTSSMVLVEPVRRSSRLPKNWKTPAP